MKYLFTVSLSSRETEEIVDLRNYSPYSEGTLKKMSPQRLERIVEEVLVEWSLDQINMKFEEYNG